MAGIEFWPEMRPLPDRLERRIQKHDQTVTVFTNVVFDTSQVHANANFSDMFGWLTEIKQVIDNNPQTYFVIRAHPDEDRPGKASQESVANWVESERMNERSNLTFIGPSEYVDSYALIELSDLVLVYNSSIGLEASIMGKPVLAAGSARFTSAETVFTAPDRQSYLTLLNSLLEDAENGGTVEFVRNSRLFLYYELYRASLDLSEFLEPFPDAPGMVRFSGFDLAQLAESPAIRQIVDGVLNGVPFVIPEYQVQKESVHAS